MSSPYTILKTFTYSYRMMVFLSTHLIKTDPRIESVNISVSIEEFGSGIASLPQRKPEAQMISLLNHANPGYIYSQSRTRSNTSQCML